MSGVKGMIQPRLKTVDEIVRLHVEEGLSTQQIATRLKRKKNSIIGNLRYRGVLRKSLGRDIEEEVAKWFEKKGIAVERQRGDAPFDLLVQGQRIDVKSANVSFGTPKAKAGRFSFELQHKNSSPKNHELFIDWFYCVFLNDTEKLIYKIRPSEISAKRLVIPASFKTKYALQYVGRLI